MVAADSGALRVTLAALAALASLVLLGDVLWSIALGTPELFWAVLPLGPMRLASVLALSLACGLCALVCARGLPRTERARAALLLGCVAALFLGNGRYVGSNDAGATRLIPFVLLREGRLCFEGSAQLELPGGTLPYWFVPAGEHIISRYPVATGILAAPAYLPALLGRYDPRRERVHELERIAAALLALTTVALVLAFARRVLPPAAAGFVAVCYALGTGVASILSKALWQHVGGAAGFGLALAGLLLIERRRAFWAIGLGCGIAVAARSTNVVPALWLLLAAAFAHGPRSAALAAAVSCGPALAQLAYARYYFGSFLGHGYGSEAQAGWSAVWSEGVLGILLSPGRGLLLYSPLLAFAAFALYRGDPALDRRVSRCLLLASVSLLLVMGKWWCWWGGRSAGERMTSDVLPLWGVGLALAYKQLQARPGLRRAFHLCALYGVLLQTLITFGRPGPLAKQLFVDVSEGAWSWRAFAPLSYLLDLTR